VQGKPPGEYYSLAAGAYLAPLFKGSEDDLPVVPKGGTDGSAESFVPPGS